MRKSLWTFPKPIDRSISSYALIRSYCFRILRISNKHLVRTSFPGGSEVKASAWDAGDPGSIPGLGRSPGEGNGNPLQYSCPWRIPWREEPGRLQSMGSQRVGHGWATSLRTSLSVLLLNKLLFSDPREFDQSQLVSSLAFGLFWFGGFIFSPYIIFSLL